MTPEPFEHSEETEAWAALYSLGFLPTQEKELFEQHLHTGCSQCARQVQNFTSLTEELALSAPPATPSAAARDQLFASLGGDHARVPDEKFQPSGGVKGVLLKQPGILITRSSEKAWERIAPGLDRKVLFIDSEHDQITALVRVQPRTRYPSHRHAGVEELLLLEGDLHIHGVVMRPGDYCRAEPDTVHEVTFSQTGCMLLLRTSLHDEIRV